MIEAKIAAKLFTGVTRQKPPKVPRPIPWNEWRIEVHDNDGSQPLYRLDRAAGVLHAYLHEGQRRAFESDKRFVFMIAGKQSGKTVLGPLRLLEYVLAYGAGDYLAVSATFDLFKFKMLPALKQLFVNDLGIARYWSGDGVLELRNPVTGEFGAKKSSDHEKMWGRIILRSADSERGLQSATAQAAWLDEPGLYASHVWKDVRGRLSLHAGPAFGTTTPYTNNWLKQEIYDPWTAGSDEIEVVQFSSRLSPFFSDAEYESLRASMSEYQFKMDYDAEFGRPPAGIYEAYINALRENGGHKVKRFVIPSDWARYVAIDPGVVNPGKIWVAHDPRENIYYIYRAQKGGVRRTSKEHAADDVKFASENNERVVWWAIGSKSEKYWREDYKAAGANGVREPKITDVWQGIDRGVQLIKQHRVYIFDDLSDFTGEMMSYAREIVNGEVVNKIKDKSTFHLMDAYRYFAQQVVSGRKQRYDFNISEDNYAS